MRYAALSNATLIRTADVLVQAAHADEVLIDRMLLVELLDRFDRNLHNEQTDPQPDPDQFNLL